MPIADVAPAPLAFLEFCVRNPEQCASDSTVAPVDLAASSSGDVNLTTAAIQNADQGVPGRLLALAAAPTAADEDMARQLTKAILLTEGGAKVIAGEAPLFDSTETFTLAASTPRLDPPAGAPNALDLFAPPAEPTEAGAETAAPAKAVVEAAPFARAPGLMTSSALLAQLNRVNRQINSAIAPVADLRSQGTPDHWDMPLTQGLPAVGDCEDYVLEKRRALIAEGIPAAALSIAIAALRNGENHAVLLVTTDAGELVLDNLSMWVTPWDAVNYTWIQRQAPGQPMNWVSVGSTFASAD